MRNLGKRFLPVCAQGLIQRRRAQRLPPTFPFQNSVILGERETRGTGAEEKNPRAKEILLWISVTLGFHPALP